MLTFRVIARDTAMLCSAARWSRPRAIGALCIVEACILLASAGCSSASTTSTSAPTSAFTRILPPASEPKLCRQEPSHDASTIVDAKVGVIGFNKARIAEKNREDRLGVFEQFYGGCFAYYNLQPKHGTVSVFFDPKNPTVRQQQQDVRQYFEHSGIFVGW